MVVTIDVRGIYPSTYRSVFLSISLSSLSDLSGLCICLSTCPPVHLSVRLSITQPTHLYILLSVCLSDAEIRLHVAGTLSNLQTTKACLSFCRRSRPLPVHPFSLTTPAPCAFRRTGRRRGGRGRAEDHRANRRGGQGGRGALGGSLGHRESADRRVQAAPQAGEHARHGGHPPPGTPTSATAVVGLVVKVSASRAEDPGFESPLRRVFFFFFFPHRAIPVT